jgi:hypothetical protein
MNKYILKINYYLLIYLKINFKFFIFIIEYKKMSQASIDFDYNGRTITIQGKDNETMEYFCEGFANKAGIDIQKTELNFIYNGNFSQTFDKNQTFLQTANSSDLASKKMSILVAEKENEPQKDLFVKSNEIICPICLEYALISLKNYKISLYNCINKHQTNDILLTEFEKTQNINYCKITCGECDKKRSNIFKYEMAFCLECKKKLCPLCKGKHDTSHNLINYNQINFICQKHNDFFLKYCNKCNLNICMSCEEEHEDHDTLYFGSIIPKEKDLKNYIDELTKYKNILNEE